MINILHFRRFFLAGGSLPDSPSGKNGLEALREVMGGEAAAGVQVRIDRFV